MSHVAWTSRIGEARAVESEAAGESQTIRTPPRTGFLSPYSAISIALNRPHPPHYRADCIHTPDCMIRAAVCSKTVRSLHRLSGSAVRWRVGWCVNLPVQAHAHAVGDVADTLAPQELVEQSVDAHILSAHGLASKVADGLQGAGGALLEGAVADQAATADSSGGGKWRRAASSDAIRSQQQQRNRITSAMQSNQQGAATASDQRGAAAADERRQADGGAAEGRAAHTNRNRWRKRIALFFLSSSSPRPPLLLLLFLCSLLV